MTQEEIGVPYTHDDAVAENIERIQRYYQEGNAYMSTSQKIMIGLALCREELLAEAGYPASQTKAAWARLDDPQRDAITRWWKD